MKKSEVIYEIARAYFEVSRRDPVSTCWRSEWERKLGVHIVVSGLWGVMGVLWVVWKRTQWDSMWETHLGMGEVVWHDPLRIWSILSRYGLAFWGLPLHTGMQGGGILACTRQRGRDHGSGSSCTGWWNVQSGTAMFLLSRKLDRLCPACPSL